MSLTRRHLMQAGAAALAAKTLSSCVGSPAAAQFTGYIDAHSHVWSEDLKRYPLASFASEADMQPRTFTDDELLALVRPFGVDRVVLIQHWPLHAYDNSYVLDCAKRHPGVFSVVAMIDERRSELRKRLHALRAEGARGIRIIPVVHADKTPRPEPMRWLESEQMRALWQHAAELDVAICPLLEAGYLHTLEPMCARFPQTTCVIDHFGHVRADDPRSIASLTRLARYKNVHVKLSAFYKFGDKKAPYGDLEGMIQPIVKAFGPERLMWATDCPYQLNDGNNFPDALSLFRDEVGGLSEGDRLAILRDTAARVFF